MAATTWRPGTCAGAGQCSSLGIVIINTDTDMIGAGSTVSGYIATVDTISSQGVRLCIQ